ncbi:MAG TPA: penicillin acylase family protein [Polyangiaceae bacterium LLY-WYZ-14_1]|nr:penicillin acylase family protein [Polyangiaceae bacterium LLY-WYZ-14_1]
MRGRRGGKGARFGFSLVMLTVAAAGCGDDGGGNPSQVSCPGESPAFLEGREVDRTIDLDGLACPVDVVVDSRGIPHIYAANFEDVLFAQGYLMAEDRFPQMEFLRRNVLGRLAEVIGRLDDSLVGLDARQRFFGFGRVGKEVYDALPEDDPSRRAADAFVAGVNRYVAEVQAGERPEADLGVLPLLFLYASENFGPWAPEDVFALARFQAFSLSYDAGNDIEASRTLAGALDAFPGDADDPALRARQGFFADIAVGPPARQVYTLDGFPNVGSDGGTRAILPPGSGGTPTVPGAQPLSPPLPSRAALDRAAAFSDSVDDWLASLVGDAFRGSNNWLVAGEHTASGLPILANDPHLQLTSPPIWWMVHLNTAAKGGDLDVMGVSFAGIPGVVIGWNRDVAWGVTTTGYDVTDVYAETIDRSADGAGTVRFNGEEVAIETVTETILVDQGDPVEVDIQVVPHHGPLLAAPPSAGGWEDTEVPHPTEDGRRQAFSIRYTGFQPTNELAAFIGFWFAEDWDDARAALEDFQVGSQNFMFAFADGTIAYSTQARIPQRAPAACTLEVDEDGAVSGISPSFVLPGQGDHEWTEPLSDRYIPHAVNPAAGYIATANQDNVGVTDDGNICNGVDPLDPADDFYLGGGFAQGYRMSRIVSRLEALIERGDITPEDMRALQAETRSTLGESLRDPFVAVLDRVAEVRSNPDGTDDAALRGLVEATSDDELDAVEDARQRLAAWSLEAPHGWQAEDPQVVADSIATTLFMVPFTRLAPLVLGDEADRVGDRPGTQATVRILERMILSPEQLATYDAELGDTVLWDDLDTPNVVETRDERILQAFLDGLRFLTDRLGSDDPADWAWWRLHGVRFDFLFPTFLEEDDLSIPADGSELPDILSGVDAEGQPEFEDAYPRDGDYGAPDVCNFSVWAPNSFTCGSGPSVRLVAEVGADAPEVIGALPGGQSVFPDSPFKSDGAALWWRNLQPPFVYRDGADVVGDATRVDRLR